jgi:hypothetical protein
MSDILPESEIPYAPLARDLFSPMAAAGQAVVPFLGAGVSISGRKFPPHAKLAAPPPREEIDQALSLLNLAGKSRALVEMAILLAFLLQTAEQGSPPVTADAYFEHLKNQDYPPSASELTEHFSLQSKYSSFTHIGEGLRKLFPQELFSSTDQEQTELLQLLARVTRIANPPESLTSITSYYENFLGRKRLLDDLRAIISNKELPTRTHMLLAEAAKYHLQQPSAKDYLIITTNYDCLMEKALDHPDLKVPYVVLTTTKGENPKVMIRFSAGVEERETLEDSYANGNEQAPTGFVLFKAQKLAIIYKIHGCIRLNYANEGLVISDNDYVDYLSQMNKTGMIPSTVSELMRNKPLWFLGYSLSDWNVRSIYETVKKKSNPNRKDDIRDFAVMYSVGDFERLFFDKNKITIGNTDLNTFANGIMGELPEALRVCQLSERPEGS